MLNAMKSSTLNVLMFRMLNMKLLSERLSYIYKERPELEGTNGQIGLIKASGASKSVVNQWLSDKIKSLDIKYALAIERNLGFSHIWLMTGEGEPRVSAVRALHPDDAIPDDVVIVPESKVDFAAGNGREFIFEIVEDSEPATYRLSWFQRERINPDRARRFRVYGDSQEDFLYHRDTILVNLDETNVVDGKLYAIRYGNDLRVKFLFRRLDGTLVLHSRNPAYPDEHVPPELVDEHISIIGRVRDKSGKGGL